MEQSYTFASFVTPPGLPSALLKVSFEEPPAAQALFGFKFPDRQCNAAFTSCTDPFPP